MCPGARGTNGRTGVPGGRTAAAAEGMLSEAESGGGAGSGAAESPGGEPAGGVAKPAPPAAPAANAVPRSQATKRVLGEAGRGGASKEKGRGLWKGVAADLEWAWLHSEGVASGETPRLGAGAGL